MNTRLPKLRIDPLIIFMVIAVIVAAVAPARGQFAETFNLVTKLGIGLLFYLYGARLSPREALKGLTHWRLHLTILTITFIIFPLIGLLFFPLRGHIPEPLFLGLLYTTLVPSTVQSSVQFTSIARGNVAGAIVSASASNLAGVILTPLLVMVFMSAGSGVRVDGEVFLQIAIQVLLPFILGQLTRKWVVNIATHKASRIVDRSAIVLVVYSAFSAGMVAGVLKEVKLYEIFGLIVISVVLVAAMMWLTRFMAYRLKFSSKDMITIQFCGTKKSLATGLPMAAVIFGGGGLGLLILPLMIFHQIQLLMCAALASHYDANGTAEKPNPYFPDSGEDTTATKTI